MLHFPDNIAAQQMNKRLQYGTKENEVTVLAQNIKQERDFRFIITAKSILTVTAS